MGVCLDEEQTSIVSQFYAQGSCYKVFLRDRRNVPWKDLLKVVKGAAAGILHLHAENYIHRDIASRNILISDSFEGIVTDFGMSRLQLRDGSQSITYLGPVKWMAPESIRDRIISKATDVYMFGSFMWELIMRDIPYADEDPFAAALKVINQGCSLSMPEDCHPGYLALMEACLKTAPEERPPFVEILMRLEELYEEAETNLSLTYAKPSTTGLILAQKATPKSGYVDSSPVFDLGTLKLESSPSPFKPESKLNKSLNSSGSSKSSSVGYMDAMPTGGTGYMDAMPRSESPLGVPNTRTSLGVPSRRKSTPVNPDGYLTVMPTIAINANGYIFTTSDISTAHSSSSYDTGSSSPTGNTSPTSSGRTSKDEARVKTSATSAPRSIPSPGRPKSMAGGSVSPSNGTPSAISKFQPGSLDSALGSSSYSSSLPAASPSSTTTTTPAAPSVAGGRANSLKISTSSSPSPTTTNTPPLSPTNGPRRMSASSSSNGAGTGPRNIPHSIAGTGAASAPNIGVRTRDQNAGTISPSASSPSVNTNNNTRFGNTCETPLRGNITLYSARVIPSSELLGWKPQFHMEHTFKRSRMSSSAPSRASPVHMSQSGGVYPPENNNGNGGSNNTGNHMPHSPQTHYGGNHGHSGLSVSMGTPGTSPYTMRSPHTQQQPMQGSHGHHAPSYQQPSGGGLSASQGRTPLNNSSVTSSGSIGYGPHGIMYAPTSNAPTSHMQPQGYKPMQVNNQPQNPFSHGGMGFQPVHAMVHGGNNNNYQPAAHQHSGHSVSPTQAPNSYSVPQNQPNQQNNKQGLSQSAKSKSPTSPQVAQQSPQQAPVQQQPPPNTTPVMLPQQSLHTSGYQPQQPMQATYGVQQFQYPAAHNTNYGAPHFYAQPYPSPQSSHPPSSVTSSTYTKPLPTLPQSSFTSSTYPKPLPAIPEANSRKSYAPSYY